jgi:hypothetical protein
MDLRKQPARQGSLTELPKQRGSSDRFGRYRLSERVVGYNKKWFGHQEM